MRRRFTLALVAATSLALVGCGSSVPEGAVDAEWQEAPPGDPDHDPVIPVGPGGDLQMDMDSFAFEVTGGRPVTGPIEVTVTNVSEDFHDATFVGATAEDPEEDPPVPQAEGGETDTETVLLFPGETTVYCSVPGHREAGMETTVTVYASEEEAEAAAEEGELPGQDDDGGDEDGGDAADGDGGGDEDVEPVDPAG